MLEIVKNSPKIVSRHSMQFFTRLSQNISAARKTGSISFMVIRNASHKIVIKMPEKCLELNIFVIVSLG